MRLALGIEYDGSAFFGWQEQARVRTVQSCLDEALSTVANEPVKSVCGGRTDSGVHAIGQVVHIDTAAERGARSWILGTNVNLPNDVAVRWSQPVAADFHARFSALRRHYRYVILNRTARPGLWSSQVSWEPRYLDEARMHRAAQHLLGEHDFSAYRARGCEAKHPVRRIEYIEVSRQGEWVFLVVVANAFLQHMVRNIAGVLIAIGIGEADESWTRTILQSQDRDAGGVTAPPQGLYLTAIEYPSHFGLPKMPNQLDPRVIVQ
jgi:tRNA pseudouridine38-40 synthase